METDVFIGFGLLGLFIGLALAEAAWPPHGAVPTPHSDKRLLTNFSLTALVLLLSSALPLASLATSWITRDLGLGLANHFSMPWLVIFALTFLGQTLVAYWVHRMMHAAPLLWRVHRVHHSDNAVDVSTSLRNHPLELAVTLPASALIIVLLGTPASTVVAVQTTLLAAALWQHADIRVPHSIDRALAQIIVTPRLHRLHHSPEREVHDSNFGEVLTLWDRLFGTFNPDERRGPVGLESQAARPDALVEQIFSPLRAS